MKKITFLLFTLITVSIFGQVKLTHSIDQYKNESGTWIDSSRNNYTYDTNNNLVLEEWENSYKNSYSYNSNNLLIEEVNKNWDTNTNAYVNAYKTNYTYNSSGKVTQNIQYGWQSNAWVNSSKNDFTYVDNKVSAAIFNNWDGSQWISNERGTVTYDSEGAKSIVYEDKENSDNWEVSYRRVFTRNANGKIIEVLLEVWNGSNWENEEKINYSLDANGNRIEKVSYFYRDNVWVENYGTTNTFDTSALMADYIHPFKDKTSIEYIIFEDFPYINKLTSSSSGTDNRTIYMYDDATASVKDFQSVEFKVFPNPTKSLLTIR